MQIEPHNDDVEENDSMRRTTIAFDETYLNTTYNCLITRKSKRCKVNNIRI